MAVKEKTSGWYLKTSSIWASLSLSNYSFACAVCGVPVDKTSDVFVASTLFLSFIPLAAMGGFIFYLWRKAQAPDPTDKEQLNQPP